MSEKSFDLGTFLADQSKVGPLEHSGEFSISHTKAMEKLAQYSLTGGYTWLLKLLQAVALWQPEYLRVRQTRGETAFFFKPLVSITEFEVAETFRQGVSHKTEPLPQLCLALRALVEQGGLSFILSINGETPSTAPIYSGADFGKLSERQRLRQAHFMEHGVKLVVSHYKGKESFTGRELPTFTGWTRRDHKIASSLEDNAIFYPVPIYLNDRLLNVLADHREYGFNPKGRPVLLSGVKCPEGTLPTLPVPATFERKLLSISTTSARAQRPYMGRRDFDVWYLLHARRPRTLLRKLSILRAPTHEILWLKDGIVVERSTAKGKTQATELIVVISAQDFQTDLSGLALTQSEERQLILRRALELIEADIAQLADNPAFLERPDVDESSLAEDPPEDPKAAQLKTEILPTLGVGTLGLVVMGLVTPAFPLVMGSVGLAGLCGYCAKTYHTAEETQAKANRRWVEVVSNDLKRLTDLNSLKFQAGRGGSGAGVKRDELFVPKKTH
jgi:hypothetical protein